MTKKQEIEELKDELKMQGQRKDHDARLIEFLNDKIDAYKVANDLTSCRRTLVKNLEDIIKEKDTIIKGHELERDIFKPNIEQESRDIRKRLEFAEAFINEGCMSELYDFVLEAQAKEHE